MDDFLVKMQQIYPSNYDEVLKAYEFAKDAHKDQKRASGEEYFIHPREVAGIVADLGLDPKAVEAALLHDVIEDTPVTDDDISREFGDEVLFLVEGLTKLSQIHFKSSEEEHAENFRKIFFAMAKDVRVIIIKLSDRLHNMRSLQYLSRERQIAMARETLEIYSPLAGRLGISQIKCELDDLCLKYLEPTEYRKLADSLRHSLSDRQEFVSRIVEQLKELLANSNIDGDVFGRPKHLYSIYKKMKEQRKGLDEIFDLIAVRIIVNSVDDCYELLGKIHKKWKPVPGRIKDYIATPKKNDYQSLHTSVVTEYGQTFEIQIRTKEMHRTAEYGIAAHWKYKEKRAESSSFDKRLSWIREVMEWQGGLGSSTEFLDTLKGDLYTTELLVITPKGKVISLAKDATPIDFAYAIHSEVGDSCVGAKVNGKIVPLNTTLQVGDVVDIMTSNNSKGPSWDWLKIVKSTSAKAKIKQFFKKEMKEENIKLGKSMLEREAKHKGYDLSELLANGSFEKLAEKFSFSSEDEMYASIGYGAISVNTVLIKLVDYYRKDVHILSPNYQISGKEHTAKNGNISIKGMTDLLVRYAKCCNPLPGDDIIGFVSRGRGVCIHRSDCPNMKKVEPERLIEASWTNTVNSSFVVSIVIKARIQGNSSKVLNDMMSNFDLKLTNMNIRMDKNDIATIDLSFVLTSKEALDNVMEKLRADKRVIEVFRNNNQ